MRSTDPPVDIELRTAVGVQADHLEQAVGYRTRIPRRHPLEDPGIDRVLPCLPNGLLHNIPKVAPVNNASGARDAPSSHSPGAVLPAPQVKVESVLTWAPDPALPPRCVRNAVWSEMVNISAAPKRPCCPRPHPFIGPLTGYRPVDRLNCVGLLLGSDQPIRNPLSGPWNTR